MSPRRASDESVLPDRDPVPAATEPASAVAEAPRPDVARILAMQRSAGNAAVARMLRPPPAPVRQVARQEDDEGGFFDSIGEGLSDAGDFVAGEVSDAGAAVAGGLSDAGAAVAGGLSEAGEAVAGGLDAAGDAISGGLSALADTIVGELQGAWATVRETASGLVDGLKRGVGASLGGIGDAFGAIKAALLALDAGALSSAWSGITGTIGGTWDAVQAGAAGVRERLGSLWSGLQQGFTSGVGAIAGRGASLLGDLADQVGAGGLLDAAKERVTAVWDGIQGGWSDLSSSVTSAVDGVVEGVSGLWTKIQGFSITDVVGKLAEWAPALKTIQGAVDDPEGITAPFVDGVATQLEGVPVKAQQIIAEQNDGGGAPATESAAAPAAAPAAVTAPPAAVLARRARTRSRTPRPAASRLGVQRQDRGVATWAEMWDGLGEAISAKWSQVSVKALLWDMFITLLWPWPAVGRELVALWTDWGDTLGEFYVPANPLSDPLGCLHDVYTNLMKIPDFITSLARHVVNIGLALMGWVTLALMIAGAIEGAAAGTVVGGIAGALASLGIGTGPAAAGGAVGGGLAGAGAGLGVALGLGEALVIAYVAAEATSVGKALLDLKTARQTPDEQARDYNRVADGGIGLAICAILLLLGWIGSKLATMAAGRLMPIMPEAVRSAAGRFKAGVDSVRKGKPPRETDETPVDETPVEETPVEETPVEERPVEETPVAEPTVQRDALAQELGLDRALFDKLSEDLAGRLRETMQGLSRDRVNGLREYLQRNLEKGRWPDPVVEDLVTMPDEELARFLDEQAGVTWERNWRGDPHLEDGNANEGWQHIDERHVTGNSAEGPGDLFPEGTTRAEVETAINDVVRRGGRISNPARRIQTFEDRVTIHGRSLRVRVTVDAVDGRVITAFPVITGP